jgi:hypothetical protein
MGDYLPGAPINEEVRRSNQNLPGQGGVFNLVNLHVYHYAGNNPVKYTDPDGRAAGDEFDTMDDAAIDFAWTYIDDSIEAGKEFGSSVYKTENGKYSYTVPSVGDKYSVSSSVHPELKTEAILHTHTDAPNMGGFSADDEINAEKLGVPNYMVTVEGDVTKFDPSIKTGNYLDNYILIGWGYSAGNGRKDETLRGFRGFADHVKHFWNTGSWK